jgi:tetratricopeptide (TPR) repeat protein
MRVLKMSFAALLGLSVLTEGASAQSIAGPYLAGRSAAMARDFDAAADYYTRALARDRSNAAMQENTIVALLSRGALDRALPIARLIEEADLKSQVAHMVVTAGLVKDGRFDDLIARDAEDRKIGPLVDGLVQAWAQLGAGDPAQALAAFDALSEETGLKGFALYHKAMALASVGDFESADAIFADGSAGGLARTRRGALAWAEIMSQLDRNEDALEMLEGAFGTGADPEVQAMRTRLTADEQTPFSYVTSVQDGMAEVFYSVAAALSNETGEDYTLLYSRVAEYLRPNHVDATLLSATLLDELGQYDLAIETYKRVSSDNPSFHAAELGRAEALARDGKVDASIEVLEQLARSYPDLAVIHTELGDLFRTSEEFEKAAAAYDQALLLTPEGARSEWFLLYARGISHERLDMWDKAEADFRSALERNPDQPQVLNYLGYSMVEKGINLDEALSMIERAVEARPDSGYIIDSLGWVLYRLGRYDEAVEPMEKAVEIEAVDPIVNDHLGDVYWAVGRTREAEFQWHRALSFEPKEEDAARIRRKLEVGLDVVLEEEGAPALKLATD